MQFAKSKAEIHNYHSFCC